MKIPTIEVIVNGKLGHAYFDTAARTSVASTQLYQMLSKSNQDFEERLAEIVLADGTTKQRRLLATKVGVTFGGRTVTADFVMMPEANVTRTLLGIDFLEAAGIVLKLPQRCWSFIDEDMTHNFVRVKEKYHHPRRLKRTPLRKKKDCRSFCNGRINW